MPVYPIYASDVADSNGQAVVSFVLPAGLQHAVLSRLVAGVPYPSTTVLVDSFSTAVASGWGTPDTGPAFVVSGTNIFSVSGGAGQATNAATGAVVAPVGVADGDLYATIAATGNTAAGTLTDVGRLLLRATDVNKSYWLRWDTTTGQVSALAIGSRVGGVDVVLAGPVAVGPFAVSLNLRFRVIGTVLTGTAWASGSTEPTTPDVVVTDATIQTAGGMGMMRTARGNATAQLSNLIGTSGAASPTWDMYENLIDPTTLLESSQGQLLPRWVPTLVNGRRVEAGFQYLVVARGLAPGALVAITADLLHGKGVA